MPMEYIVPSLRIYTAMTMDEAEALEECIMQLIQFEEYHFIDGFHQQVAKDRQKVWHDCHIKKRQFVEGDWVLLYDSNFMKHPGKLQMHWLGLYIVHSITFGGAIQLQQLYGVVLLKHMNGSRLNPYRTWAKGCTS